MQRGLQTHVTTHLKCTLHASKCDSTVVQNQCTLNTGKTLAAPAYTSQLFDRILALAHNKADLAVASVRYSVY